MTTLTNIYQNKRKSFTNVHLFPKFETRNKAIQESVQHENPTYGRLAYRTNFFRLRPERRVLSLFRLDKRTHRKTGNLCFINHRRCFRRCKSFCSGIKTIYRFMKETTTSNPGLQIVVIAGNHDSVAHLETPIPLLGKSEHSL